jgi:hypothetical protein
LRHGGRAQLLRAALLATVALAALTRSLTLALALALAAALVRVLVGLAARIGEHALERLFGTPIQLFVAHIRVRLAFSHVQCLG